MKLKILIILMLVQVFASVALSKDIFYLKQEVIMPAMDGEAKHSISEQYISDDIIKILNDDAVIVIDNSNMYNYNVKNSTYYTLPLKNLAPYSTQIDSQFKGFKIKSTGEKQKIGKWNTEKYTASITLMGMAMEIDMYFCKDLHYPADLLSRQQLKMFPNAENVKKMVKDIEKIGGVQVKSVAKIAGTQTITNLLDIKKIPYKKSLFFVPKGFRKIDAPKNPMGI